MTAERDVAAVTTMHDLNMALRYADRFILLKDGVIHAAGSSGVVTPETIEAVYGAPVTVERYSGFRFVVPRHRKAPADDTVMGRSPAPRRTPSTILLCAP